MRLIPVKFRDYYDGLQGVDRVPTPLWVRQYAVRYVEASDKKAAASLGPVARLVLDANPTTEPVYFPAVLAVTGRGWPILVGYSSWSWGDAPRLDGPVYSQFPYVAWTFEELQARVLGEYGHRGRGAFSQRVAEKWEEEPKYGFFPNDPGRARSWLQQGELEVSVDLHRQLKSPILLLLQQRSGLVVATNVPLAPFRMQERMRAQQVWQNVDRFLGNEMAVQEDPPPLSDELRRDAHGFDEWSFKQPAPGQKKARRRAKKGST